MSSASISTDAMSPRDIHGSLPAIAATICMAALLAPFALMQFGLPGLSVLVAFAAAVVVSVWIAAWGEAKLYHSNRLLAGLLASSGIRMAVPLVLALVVVVGHGRIGPVESAIYVVPLYLSMLSADVFVCMRNQARSGERIPGGRNAHGSTARGEAG